ncbi:homolog of yeast DRE2 [Hibiscus trionum]|nr:homolog of yeast DRE2 [Hibiscus trionum]
MLASSLSTAFFPSPLSFREIRTSIDMDSKSERSTVLAITDDASFAVTSLNAIWDSENEDSKRFDPLIVMQASSLARLPLDSSYVNLVIYISKSVELPGDELYAEIFRVLMPGGVLVVYGSSQPGTNEADAVMSAIERKLLLAGFSDGKCFRLKSVAQSFGVKATKPSWKIGSSFAIKKKTVNNPLKIEMDDSDLIDEDSLLTEEDLKKPQLPPVGDCEVGTTRKACKNCTCGRAEQEEKVQKLELTMDQLNNPQSACGSCGLGDAFRCSTCPYKGLAPFKLGEKVSLSGNFLTADI